MRCQRFGPLDARVVGGTDGTGGGNGPMVVLLHGFGAPGDDLVPLAGALDVPSGTRFVFPAGPLRLPGLFGDSRAWWMIDLEERIQTVMRDGLDALIRDTPEGMAEANQMVSELIDAATGELGTPAHLVLGGFSQGAMLALDVALRSDRPLAGLVLLSGTLLGEGEWVPRMVMRAGTPVFQSHGRRDPLLPFAIAEKLRDHLKSAGVDVNWLAFDGAHEIPPEALVGAGALIDRVTG